MAEQAQGTASGLAAATFSGKQEAIAIAAVRYLTLT